ncbi:MAG: response regulator [Planctomycetes bacterium]|nr:response regulator [Planctomycetota bacterium]
MPQGRILFVDDDKDFLKVTGKVLAAEGYDVVTLSDGEEGILRARTEKWDLVILDIVMPGLDGYRICERLKSGVETFSIPVLFLSGKKDAGDMLRGFFTGAHDYLVKPVTKADLLKKVDHLIR